MSERSHRNRLDLESLLGSSPSERTLRRGTELGGLFPPSFSADYLMLEEGRGPFVRDQDGNWYIDMISGSKNVNIGYGREEVVVAADEQLMTLPFVSSGHGNNSVTRLADRIAKFTPPGFNKSWFVSGGSLANESAFKMAHQYHLERGESRKYKILSRSGSFHGNTTGAMAVSGTPRFMTKMDLLFPNYPKVPSATPYRCNICGGEGGRECGIRCAEEVDRTIRDEGPETVAAFIVEPVNTLTEVGAFPHEGYFERVREICNEHDVLLIADEIMTGFGRTGRPFAMQHWDVTPDIITAGKGLSSGYVPHGATIPHDRVVEVFEDAGYFAHSHTYSNNPLAAAISNAVLEYTEEHNVLENAGMTGAYLGDRLRELYQHESVGDIRGKGMVYGIEFVRNRATKEPPREPSLPLFIKQEGLNEGLLTATERGHIDGENGIVTIIAPPLTVSETIIDAIVDRLHRIISTAQSQLDLIDEA